MSNQTQMIVQSAAQLALHEWVKNGDRTYERLMALADKWTAKLDKNYGPLPKVMVWSETLRLLRERIPDAMPLSMGGAT